MSQMATPRTGRQTLKRIAGFDLLEKVGQGGMGAVFKARQLSLDRIVALKVLPPSIAKNTEFIARFLREARAAGRLNHPNIVQAIDVGQCEKTGLYFFAMEYVDGPTLGRRLKESGAFPEDFVREVARQMGEALGYANQRGIVHRDVKPDNILINGRGQIKLADLGLAKQVAKQEDASLTQAGIAVGTPYYMAPEQIRGELDLIDTRTDLYSLGATLFHLATGAPPYPGATTAVIMAAHLNDKTPLANRVNPNVSEGFSRLLFALMQKDRNRRPVDPGAFLEMLARIDEGGGATKGSLIGVRGTTGPRDAIRSTTGPRERVRPATGPRERVAGGASSGQASAVGANRKLYLVAGIAVALLVGGGLLALTLSGGKEDVKTAVAGTKETPKPGGPLEPVRPADPVPVIPVAPPIPQPHWNPAEELEHAKRAIERNPKDLRGICILWERLLADAQREKADPAWIKRFTDARDEARARYEEQVSKAHAELNGKVRDLCAAGQFDQALVFISEVPSSGEKAERAWLKALSDGVCSQAEETLKPLLQQVRTALQAGRLDEAAARLEQASTVKYRLLAGQVDGLRKQLANAQAERNESARKAADERWAKLLAEFDATVLEKGDMDLLQKVLKAAGEDKVLDARKQDVSLLSEVGTRLMALIDRDRKSLSSLVGQSVEWTIGGKKVAGRVKAVKDGVVDLMVSLDRVEMIQKVKLSELSGEDAARFRPPLNPQGASERMAAALLKMRKGAEDPAAAAAFLEGAGDSILAQHYRDGLRRLQSQDVEAAAESAWAEITRKAAEPKLTPKQSEELYRAIERFNQTHGQSRFAAERKQAIAELAAKHAPKEQLEVTADRVVLWNLCYSDSGLYYYGGTGTVKADLTLFYKGRVVGSRSEIKVAHKSTASVATEVQIPGNIVFDRVRIDVTNWTGAGGGFTEIQVFKGDENLALGRLCKASDAAPDCDPSRATDGEISRSSYYTTRGWMLASRGKGWIEVDFSKPAARVSAPGRDVVEAEPVKAIQGGWQAPMGGTIRMEEGGRTSLSGPGTGDAKCAVALFDGAVPSDFNATGQFQRHGSSTGFIVGYDRATQKFISVCSRQEHGIDLYVHTGTKREFLKHVDEVSIPEEEWVDFRISQRGPDVTIQFGESVHAFRLPEGWPEGRQIGLIALDSATARAGNLRVLPVRSSPSSAPHSRP